MSMYNIALNQISTFSTLWLYSKEKVISVYAAVKLYNNIAIPCAVCVCMYMHTDRPQAYTHTHAHTHTYQDNLNQSMLFFVKAAAPFSTVIN